MCVFFVPDLDKIDVRAVGSLVEWHPLFPQGVNVGFLQVLSKNEARLRTWERNTGQTLACGSNNCAAVVAAARRNLTDRKVLVHNDGGDIEIEWSDRNRPRHHDGPDRNGIRERGVIARPRIASLSAKHWGRWIADEVSETEGAAA